MRCVQYDVVVEAVALVPFMCPASRGLVLRDQLPPGSGGADEMGIACRPPPSADEEVSGPC